MVMFIMAYLLPLKSNYISVLHNVLLSDQIHIKNKYIGHDLLLKNGRRFNNFDYNYNDWEDKDAKTILLDYNLDVTIKDDGSQFHNYDIPPWNPAGTTSNHTRTKTTPTLTITSSKTVENTTTTEATVVEPTLNEAKIIGSDTTNFTEATVTDSQTSLNETTVTASQTNLNEATLTNYQTSLNEATGIDVKSTTKMTFPTVESPEMSKKETPIMPAPGINESGDQTEMTTSIPKPIETSTSPTAFQPPTPSETEIIMSFPTSDATEPELNTYSFVIPTDRSIHYPSDMTIPGFGDKPTEPDPVSLMFTRNLTTVSTTEGEMAKEAHHEMQEKRAGYFTTFLLEVSKVIAMKDKAVASQLFRALETEVDRLENLRQLSGFGKSTIAAFQTAVRTMNAVPTDAVQSQATLAYYLLSNRKVTISPEVVILLDLVDKIYLESEGERILGVLQDIKDYPGAGKSSSEIAADMMNAVVINPFKRVYGTPQEKYLVQRLEETIVHKYLHDVGIERRKGSPVFIKYIRTKKIRTPPTPLRETKSTKRTTISNKYAKFSKNKTIQVRFHKRMWRYKKRKDPYRWNQWRYSRTITTTTAKSTRVTRTLKSNYVIRKYVKKNLKRRKVKTTTSSNEVFPHKFIKLNEAKLRKQMKSTPKTVTMKVNSKAKPKIGHISKKPKLLNKDKTGLKLRRFGVAKPTDEQSSLTDDEEVLKANLYDAFFHSNEPVFRGGKSEFEDHFRPKHNHEISSYSDKETVIKSKIYKAFGYENDFAETVKRGHH